MERGRKVKGHLCIPKLRGNACSATKSKAAPSPMTLLERLREAVFRLIMLCALSKTTSDHAGTRFSDVRRFSYPNDHHHSESVADCIEFIKKKASSDDDNRDSSASSDSSSIDPKMEAIYQFQLYRTVTDHQAQS